MSAIPNTGRYYPRPPPETALPVTVPLMVIDGTVDRFLPPPSQAARFGHPSKIRDAKFGRHGHPANATDDEGHSLGAEDFLNGIEVPSITIDTSEPATDTIDYVATDTWGNTSTLTRTVIIEPVASSAASTTDATTTDATSTAQ